MTDCRPWAGRDAAEHPGIRRISSACHRTALQVSLPSFSSKEGEPYLNCGCLNICSGSSSLGVPSDSTKGFFCLFPTPVQEARKEEEKRKPRRVELGPWL